MGAVAGDHEDGVAVAEVHGMQGPRIGPGPELAIDLRIAEHARRAGGAGGGEHHPAARSPDRLAHGAVGAVGRMQQRVLGHLRLVDHGPFAARSSTVRMSVGDQAEAIEAAAIEVAVLVEERRHRGDLVVLDRGQLVARGGIEPRRPVIRRTRRIAVMAMAFDGGKPGLPRRRGAVRPIRHGLSPLMVKLLQMMRPLLEALCRWSSRWVGRRYRGAAMHNPPFRADIIGSLLRPPALRQAFRAFHAGELDQKRFVAEQDAAIRDAIKLQEDVGLKVVTDGEFRRGSYWSRFVERIEGLGVDKARFRFHDEHGEELAFTAPFVTAKLARPTPIALDEFTFLRDNATALAKVTLPAPSSMHFWRGSDYAAPGFYGSPRAFFRDLAKIYRAEIADLAAAGCRYIQLDEVALAMLCDPAVRRQVSDDGSEMARLIDLYVEAIAEAVSGAPAEMSVGVHMCRGNFKGKYLAEGGYDANRQGIVRLCGRHPLSA